MSKVLVIGLDGATWDLLMPLAKEGFLPTLKRLIEAGVFCQLESTIPPTTAPAWASFATGKNPGKTGIFDFLMPRRSLGDLAPVTSNDIDGKTFYEILHDYGKKTMIVNLPLSYPPRTKNPTITSILTQGDRCVFPESLISEVPELADYRIVPDFTAKVRGHDEEYFEDIRKLENTRFTCSQKLFMQEWDFFFLLFSGTDWIQHALFDKLRTNSINKNHSAFQLFQDIDNYICWFVNHLPDETKLLIMSDHGFRTYRGVFYIDKWLKENGFLKCRYVKRHSQLYHHLLEEGMDKARVEAINEEGTIRRLSLAPPNLLVDTLRRLGFGKIYRIIGKYIPIHLEMKLAVDHTSSLAICPAGAWGMGIYLNRSDRFVDGIVETKDVSTLKHQIMAGLKELIGPVTGRNAFDIVLDGEEAFSQGGMRSAPDIVVLPGEYWLWPGLLSQEKGGLFTEKSINGHAMQGIFLAFGDGIRKGHQTSGAKICDVGPTILHILGSPIPDDMDGVVLKEIFEHGSEYANRPIRYMKVDLIEQLRGKVSKIKREQGI